MPALEVDEVTISAELEALAPAWEDLWRRAPAATPFQSPAWLLPWWQEVGDGELRVVLARRSGRLVGLLPMYRQHGSGKLLPLGIGISDYLDGLFAKGDAAAVASALLRRLVDRRDWRRGELHPLRQGSPLLEARVPPGCGDQILEFDPCPVVEIPAGARDLDEILPGKIRANIRYYRRRAEQAGRVSFETATAATVAELLDALFRLHETRWQQSGVLADPAIRHFHRAAAPLLLRSGLLRLHALRLDQRVIAATYVLHLRQCTYFYVSGFDPNYGPLSPGTLILGHSIARAIGEGAREFDFLRGGERYKHLWGARERPCYGRMLDRAD